MKFNDFYVKYFANVRWTELLLAVGVAALGKLQMSVQGGGKVDQHAVIEALSVGAGVGWAFLRVPKQPPTEDGIATGPPAASVDGLPVGVDSTGPAHDVGHDVVTEAISGALPPALVAVAPDLASNITKELGRVLRRGIRW